MTKNLKLFSGLGIVILLIIIVGLWATLNNTEITQAVNSFDDCTAAGYPILQFYPRQCKTPDGKTFIEKVTPILKSESIRDLRAGSRTLLQEVLVSGVVKTGAQAGIDYCAEGLYLTDDTGALLLRKDGVMVNDQSFVGKNVEVTGRYPVEEAFCEALICECEDNIEVGTIILQ